jgi:hypothetical protein
MTTGSVATKTVGKRREAFVWIDHEQAVIVEHGLDRISEVEILLRKPTEGEAAFDGRAVDLVLDDERVVVTGPARTDFERAYVAVTHRPDRIIDVGPRTAQPGAARS